MEDIIRGLGEFVGNSNDLIGTKASRATAGRDSEGDVLGGVSEVSGDVRDVLSTLLPGTVASGSSLAVGDRISKLVLGTVESTKGSGHVSNARSSGSDTNGLDTTRRIAAEEGLSSGGGALAVLDSSLNGTNDVAELLGDHDDTEGALATVATRGAVGDGVEDVIRNLAEFVSNSDDGVSADRSGTSTGGNSLSNIDGGVSKLGSDVGNVFSTLLPGTVVVGGSLTILDRIDDLVLGLVQVTKSSGDVSEASSLVASRGDQIGMNIHAAEAREASDSSGGDDSENGDGDGTHCFEM